MFAESAVKHEFSFTKRNESAATSYTQIRLVQTAKFLTTPQRTVGAAQMTRRGYFTDSSAYMAVCRCSSTHGSDQKALHVWIQRELLRA